MTPEQEADFTAEAVLSGEENARAAAVVVKDFIASYERHKHEKPLERWLVDEFRKYPAAWKDPAAPEKAARNIVEAVEAANEAKWSLSAHVGRGKSRESWLAGRIEQGTAAAGAVEVSTYAAETDRAVRTASDDMAKTVLTGEGTVNRLANLDGFIAERHHVNTFNLNAASRGSGYRARVLEPEPGQPYAKNSVDIGIYDLSDKLVRRYQLKYGADAGATKRQFDAGNYRGQRKLVPSEQADAIDGAVDAIEFDGVRSAPLRKDEAKALQEDAQLRQEIQSYTWNDVNRVNVARRICRQAAGAAACAAVFQGARILGRRVWNWLSGKDNSPVGEDLKEFFESSLESGAHVGIQVAVAGGITVAAKNGWLGRVLRGTPAGSIASMVQVGIENAKVLYKLAKGELTPIEALDTMGRVTCGAIGGLVAAAKGGAAGATIGAVLGPPGVAVGGFVGAVVAGMAGSRIGEAIHEAGKVICKTAVKEVRNLWEEARHAFDSVFERLNPLALFS